MVSRDKIRISYFSDVLCVWAYIAQIRLDELKRQYNDQIEIHYHFLPLFGCTEDRIGHGWRDRGGYPGFGEHIRDVCKEFDHIDVHPDIWVRNAAKTSANSHLFLKAVQLLEEEPPLLVLGKEKATNNSVFEELAWRVRLAFFKHNKDISRLDCLYSIADKLKLPVDLIAEKISNGEAMAALCQDAELKDQFRVEGSPTYILNEGRQKLYGNLGYKIIEANVQEILHRPENQATWC